MRVLFTAHENHVARNQVALASALRTDGHEVCFAGPPHIVETIVAAGLTAVPVGTDRNHYRITAHKPEVLEALRPGMPAPYDVVEFPERRTWAHMLPGYAEMVRGWHRVTNFPMIADLVAFARHWRPDLVLWEPFTFAGPIAARACGAAHARVLYGVDVFAATRAAFLDLKAELPPDRREDPLADWLGGYARKYGSDFAEDMIMGDFTLDHFPASLQIEAAEPDYLRMRYIAYGGRAVIPSWLWKPPAKPRIAVTMGLTATEIYDGYTLDMQDVLDHLGDLDVEVVATFSDGEKAKLARIPANTRVVSYVPWHALAPTCSAVVHHAGAGTLLTTSLYEVPQIAIPYHFDEPLIARKLAEQGTGITIHTSQASGASIRANLLRLLDEPRFKERAVALTAEIQALPTPNDIVPQIEKLAAEYRPT